MGKYFGTDGFRGEAGVELTSLHAYKIGRFLGWYYKGQGKGARAVIGKDTRRSSYMLEYAIASGLSASGASAYMLHVTTTPGVSFVTRGEDFDLGIMISASHNPYYDNGIKIVNSRGEKLEDEVISKIEAYLDGDCSTLAKVGDLPLAKGAEIGEITDYSQGRNRYIGYLISISKHSFKGLRIGLDTANGGAFMIAKSVFDALGAKTYVINQEPNGLNINKNAGSTCIEGLCQLVRERELDMGFAFDGDADRCIAVDERGEVVNGDHILYILARELKNLGELSGNRVVTTVMSNMGLYRALDEIGIQYEQTKVGDKYVYENMMKNGYVLGGEQSGHVILSKHATTGDGILTAIKVAEAVIENKTTLSRLKEPVLMLPQVTKNVKVRSKERVMTNERILSLVEEIRVSLNGRGRILLRESGTEPLIRIMVEADTREECEELSSRVARLIYDLNLSE
ncbi:MAG: phosphoglucosamine mutase [Clostridia bacterium]|nr:phosphoglucosamine mutase [Clostridia bacterium]